LQPRNVIQSVYRAVAIATAVLAANSAANAQCSRGGACYQGQYRTAPTAGYTYAQPNAGYYFAQANGGYYYTQPNAGYTYAQPNAGYYYAQPTAAAQPAVTQQVSNVQGDSKVQQASYVTPAAVAQAAPTPAPAAEPAKTETAAPAVAQTAPAAPACDPYGFTPWLNGVRAQYGLPAVGYDPNLESWAAVNNSHQNSRGLGHFVMGSARRQNSAMGNFASIGSMWLGSPAHASALLDPTITYIGLSGSGSYWTFNAY
jgi:hypothetical protein